MGGLLDVKLDAPNAARLHHTGRHRRRAVMAVAALLLNMVGLIAGAPSASAETPSDLVDELNQDGVYVSRVRSEIDEAAIEAAVTEVGFSGLRVVVVAPIDPQPNGSAFARRIQEAVDADAAMIFLDDGTLETFVIDDLAPARIRATDKAATVDDPARAVLVFADELTTEQTTGTPAIIGRLIMAVLLLGLALGIIVGVEQSMANDRRESQAGGVAA